MRILPMDDDLIKFMAGHGLARGVIPKGTYKDVMNNDVDLPTIAMANTIVANAKTSVGGGLRFHEDRSQQRRRRSQDPPRLQRLHAEGRGEAGQRAAPPRGRESVQGSETHSLDGSRPPDHVRQLTGVVGWAAGAYAVAAALFHIWTAYAGVLEPREMRAIHLMFLLPLSFLFFPANIHASRHRLTVVDALWIVAALAPTLYVIANATELTERWEGVHPITRLQVILGTLLVLAVLEASRRTVGFWFFVTTLAFIAFLVTAPWLPGFLKSPRAYSFPQLIEMFYLYADEGVARLPHRHLRQLADDLHPVRVLHAPLGGRAVLHGHLDRSGRPLPGRTSQGGGGVLRALRDGEWLLRSRLLCHRHLHHPPHEEARLSV
jgi:hypothetical protein